MSGKTIDKFPGGAVEIPPSKSVGHRALICAGLAALGGGGDSLLSRMGDSQDIHATRRCLEALGVAFAQEGDAVRVKGGGELRQALDCGESGSTLRFMIPVAAVGGDRVTFTGRGRLLDRPLGVYATIFGERGLEFDRQDGGIAVRGPLPSGDYHLPGDVSSQFVSGLLLALPLLAGDSRIILDSPLESAAYVALTIRVMKDFGVAVTQEGDSFSVPGGQRYSSGRYRVEGDWSQAAFFLAAGALGQPVSCLGLAEDSLQGDGAIVEILRRMGAEVLWRRGALRASSRGLAAVDIDAREIPDLVPVLAVLCSLARGTSRITGAGRLRLKESDRLNAMTTELRKLGADIRQGPDWLAITGKEKLAGGAVDAHGDHRVAMALAVAAIRCDGPVILNGWEHVNKSYPRFWEDFEKEAEHG